MGIVVVPTYGSDPASVTAANLDAKVAGLATEFNGSIDNDNIKASAAIANSKLNLATVTQNITHSGTMTHSGVVTISGKILKLAKGADVASANGLTLGTDGNYFDITGTTAITSIGTLAVGTVVRLHFDAALTLTHHATDLILPGGANITTAAGDEAEFIEYAAGDWRCTSYVKATGKAVVETVQTPLTSYVEATNNNTITTTNTNFEDMTTMTATFTPGSASNVILVLFSANVKHASAGASTTLVLNIGGSAVTGTQRVMVAGSNDGWDSVSMNYMTTLAASAQTIKVQWKTSTGTASAADRKLDILEFRVV